MKKRGRSHCPAGSEARARESSSPGSSESLGRSWPIGSGTDIGIPSIQSEVESPGLADDPLEAIDQRQQTRELADALSRLTPDQRDAVVSRMVMGLDLEQTARVLGKNVGSIKSLQHRALAQLARILREGKAHDE